MPAIQFTTSHTQWRQYGIHFQCPKNILNMFSFSLARRLNSNFKIVLSSYFVSAVRRRLKACCVRNDIKGNRLITMWWKLFYTRHSVVLLPSPPPPLPLCPSTGLNWRLQCICSNIVTLWTATACIVMRFNLVKMNLFVVLTAVNSLLALFQNLISWMLNT